MSKSKYNHWMQVDLIKILNVRDIEIRKLSERVVVISDLLKALKDLQKAVREHKLLDIKKRFSLCVADAQANTIIAKAEKE